MSKTTGPLEVVHGRGNVVADLDCPNALVHQAKVVLAAEIIKALDAGGLTVRKTEVRTGIAAAGFSRTGNEDAGRFTIDRPIRILERVDTAVNVPLTVMRPPATVVMPAVRSWRGRAAAREASLVIVSRWAAPAMRRAGHLCGRTPEPESRDPEQDRQEGPHHDLGHAAAAPAFPSSCRSMAIHQPARPQPNRKL